MNENRIAFREEAEFHTQLAAYVDPVLWRHFHEVDVVRRIRQQLVNEATPQAQAGACNGVLSLCFCHLIARQDELLGRVVD